ncbi:MAG: hypothetical protein Q7S06_02365 [Nanoarchaeota archaeon]|nr:hypothetical protein [Nanoarchaeota archaeon]
MKRGKKTGLSPVIATVLLISIVVVIGMIIFLWARGFVKEEGMKLGKNIKLTCEDVDFQASYQGGILSVVNSGNVPVYRIKLKIYSDGSFHTDELSPETGIRAGGTYTKSVSITGDRMLVIPVLIDGTGQKMYTCEDQYYEVQL